MNTHELKENRNWALVMNKLPEEAGGWESTSSRDTLSRDFERFLYTVQAVNQKGLWPGVPPSCRYRFATSRCGYLTRICPVAGMPDLAHLITLLVRRQFPALATFLTSMIA